MSSQPTAPSDDGLISSGLFWGISRIVRKIRPTIATMKMIVATPIQFGAPLWRSLTNVARTIFITR